ncbi:GGDEF domain-containing protein [Marinicella meishanensis]|uniref:GGDEF domain-containing protein n=1 Tax=Marinicella meishanensis TaxID=2873263 RepID=UPI001CC0F277|nr:GGDEF domain-containing protein [Marinicella sp. NBU2979]
MTRALDKHKKTVLLVFLLITVVAAVVFAVVNYQRGQVALAVTELLVAMISLVLLVLLLRLKQVANARVVALLFILMFFSVMMFAFSLEKSSPTVFVWALVIPMVSYLLLGVKSGFILTALFYSVSFGLYYQRFHGQPIINEQVAYANVFFSALLFWILSHTYELTNQKSKDKLRKQAVYDHLTGLYNRTLLKRSFEEHLSAAMDDHLALSLVLFDLDHFKQINDRHGHAVGDEVLRRFAAVLRNMAGADAPIFRIGGEEFVVFMVTDDLADAIGLAETVRQATADITVAQMGFESITVSSGVALTRDPAETIEGLLRQADQRMYRAKDLGRNRVVHEV